MPVLAAGTPHGWGVAVIAGTGSLAFGRDLAGRTARAGGWGFLFGDEGSAYAIAVDGLRAAAQAADGRGPATQLLPAFERRWNLPDAPALIPAVYAIAGDRAAVAALAAVVAAAAAAGDGVAQRILDEAAGRLADMVAAVAAGWNSQRRFRWHWPAECWPAMTRSRIVSWPNCTAAACARNRSPP
jgi:N-acetylglucosamine kinase-like BadF-type ATPase